MDSPNKIGPVNRQMENRLSGDTIFQSCDPVQTVDEATRPIITPLLPVSGLRRDASGNLTDDAYKIIMDGIQSLGIQKDSSASKAAILQEARFVLCRLYAQYEYLLRMLDVSIARSEEFRPDLTTAIQERLQKMQDILTIVRRVAMEGGASTVEAFTDFQSVEERIRRLNQTKLRERALEDSKERNTYAVRQLGLYSFLNILAVGLLFYVMAD